MPLPDITPVVSAPGFNWFNFADPQILSLWIGIGFLLFLLIKSIYDAYKDISGQRAIEQDGGILTISRINNDAVKDNTVNVANRTYVIDRPAYRIITRFGVHLTLWICDRLTGRTIGLNNSTIKGVMSADEQNETIRAIPERMLGTVSAERGLTFILLALGAGAFLGFMVKGFMG